MYELGRFFLFLKNMQQGIYMHICKCSHICESSSNTPQPPAAIFAPRHFASTIGTYCSETALVNTFNSQREGHLKKQTNKKYFQVLPLCQFTAFFQVDCD